MTQVSMSLSMTPLRQTVLDSVRKHCSGPDGYVSTFSNSDIRALCPDLTSNQVGAGLRYLVIRGVLHMDRMDTGLFAINLYSVRDKALISNGPKDRHAVADKLLLLQGMRASMTGRPLDVLVSIIEDYEKQL